MAYQTNEEIRVDIADLTERLHQIRIDKGLPPDPKPRPKIVDIALSHAIIDRMEPFKAIVIKYASLLSQGKFVSIDTDKLAKYRQYAELLLYSPGLVSGMHGCGAFGCIAVIEHINGALKNGETDVISTTEEARRLHGFIKWMSHELRWEEWDYHDETGEFPKGKYDDEAAFQSALAEAIAQLPSKSEEGLYE